MSHGSYTEEQARLDVYEFIAKNPNALSLGKSELVAEKESLQHEKYKTRKSNAGYCRESRAKKRKLAQANTQQQRVSRPEIEAEDDDDDYVFQVKRAPFVPGDYFDRHGIQEAVL